MSAATRILVFALIALLAGCGGWYLRGQGPNKGNFSHVFLDQARSPLVGVALINEFYRRGFKRVTKRGEAEVIVKLEAESFERRTLSVDPVTGKVREVELVLSTHFSARSASGKMLIPREPLTWQLDYVFDEGSVLGTVEQDLAIQQDLANTAATAIAFRLGALKLAPEDLVKPATPPATLPATK